MAKAKTTIMKSIDCDCGSNLWDIWRGDEAECTNCLTVRPYKTRRPKPHNITKSQQKRIEQIKNYFQKNWNRGNDLFRFEVTTTDYGDVFVVVETVKSVFNQKGGFFSIGSRGKCSLMNVYDMDNKEESGRHYCKMLNAKYCVSKC